jgi:hypothetical protein
MHVKYPLTVCIASFPFLIHVPFPLLKQFAKGYVLQGQGQIGVHICGFAAIGERIRG